MVEAVQLRYRQSWKVTSGSQWALCFLLLWSSHLWSGKVSGQSETTEEEEEEMLQWIKVFFLVANSTGLRRGRLQTKVQAEIKLVWEKCRRDASKGESHTAGTAVCVRIRENQVEAFAVCVLSIRVPSVRPATRVCVSVCVRFHGNAHHTDLHAVYRHLNH